ncbi:MAG: flippase [Candidatus Kryptoniota bacterium]
MISTGLKNLTSRPRGRQPILKNVTWLAVGNLIVKPFWFVLLLLTARILGAAEFGEFMLAISFVSVASVILEGGVDILTVRQLSTNPEELGTFTGHTVFLKLISGIISGFAAIAAAYLLKMDKNIIILVSIAAVYSTSNVLLLHVRSIFRAYEILKYEAISIILEKGTVIIVCGSILVAHAGVRIYMIGYAIAYCLTAFFTFMILLKRIGKPYLKMRLSYLWSDILKPALPFAILNMFTIIYFRSGTLMLGALTGKEELVGFYNAGYRLVESFMLFPTIIVAPIYPVISRNKENIEEVKRVLIEAFRALLFIGILISFPIFIFREKITLLLYGSGYDGASNAVGILALTMIPISVNFAAGAVVAAFNRQGISNVFVLAVTSLNLVMNYFLIKGFSVNGASATTIFTELLLVISNLYVIRDSVPWYHFFLLFLKAILPAFIAWLFVAIFRSFVGFPVQIIFALTIMVGSYFILQLISFEDIRKILRTVA